MKAERRFGTEHAVFVTFRAEGLTETERDGVDALGSGIFTSEEVRAAASR